MLEFLEADIFNLSVETASHFSIPDRIVGHRPGDVRDGGRSEPPPRARAPEAIRVRRTGTHVHRRSTARVPGLPAGSGLESRCDRRGNRVSQEAAIQAKATDAAVLLPRTAKSKRSAPLSARVTRPIYAGVTPFARLAIRRRKSSRPSPVSLESASGGWPNVLANVAQVPRTFRARELVDLCRDDVRHRGIRRDPLVCLNVRRQAGMPRIDQAERFRRGATCRAPYLPQPAVVQRQSRPRRRPTVR